MTSVLVVDMPMTYGMKLGSPFSSDIDGLISLSWEYALMNTGRMAESKVRARPILMKKEAMVCGDAGMGISSVFATRVRLHF